MSIEARGFQVTDLASSLPDDRLHVANDPAAIVQLLKDGLYENRRNGAGFTPLHAILSQPVDKKGLKFACTMSFLKHANCRSLEINATTPDGDTALHIAVKTGDLLGAKCLLAFGADINVLNNSKKTPLDLSLEQESTAMVELLASLGGLLGKTIKEIEEEEAVDAPLVCPESPGKLWMGLRSNDSEKSGEKGVGSTEATDGALRVQTAPPKEDLDLELHSASLKAIRDRLLSLSSSSSFEQELVSVLRELDTSGEPGLLRQPSSFSPLTTTEGDLVLSLDGGGIKGLVLVTVLMRIEAVTGRKITEIFDWIVGTSVGGVIALALVYAKLTLPEIRKLFLEMKEEVFASGTKAGFNSNIERLEELLQGYLGKHRKLSDVHHPKVLITAVDCTSNQLTLRFFNNCFDDEFSKEFIWKVARYTSAAPVYFDPKDSYVDGGIRANNPTSYGLTCIQGFLDKQTKDGSCIACVVSLGCGIAPAVEIGDFNIQKYAVLGKEWVTSPLQLKSRFENFIMLLLSAISDSPGVSENCRCRCEKQGIAYYRYDPRLSKTISLAERDDATLLDMIINTLQYIKSREPTFERMKERIHVCLDIGRGIPKF